MKINPSFSEADEKNKEEQNHPSMASIKEHFILKHSHSSISPEITERHLVIKKAINKNRLSDSRNEINSVENRDDKNRLAISEENHINENNLNQLKNSNIIITKRLKSFSEIKEMPFERLSEMIQKYNPITEEKNIIEERKKLSHQIIFFGLLELGFTNENVTHIFINGRPDTIINGINMLVTEEDNLWHHEFIPMELNSKKQFCFNCADEKKKKAKKFKNFYSLSSIGLYTESKSLKMKKREEDNFELIIHKERNETKYSSETQCAICFDILPNHSPDYNFERFEQQGLFKEAKKPNKIVPIESAIEFSISANACLICLEDITQNLDAKLRCNHRICKTCLQKYICYKIRICQIDDFFCPIIGCREKISCDQMIDNTSYKEVESLLKWNFNKKMADSLKAIYCKNCGEYIILKRMYNNNYIVCRKCGKEICFICFRTYHSYKSCNEWLAERFSLFIRGKKNQLCPLCFQNTTICDTCNRINCLQCKQTFCKFCRAQSCEADSMEKCILKPVSYMNILINDQKEERTLCKRASICILIFLLLLCFSPFVSAYCFVKNNLSSIHNSEEIESLKKYSNEVQKNSEFKKNQNNPRKIVDLSKSRKNLVLKIIVSIFSILLGLIASPFIEILCLFLILSYIPLYLLVSK